MPRPAKLVSIAEAAEYLGVTTRSIREWITEGRLPAYRVGPKVIRIKMADLEKQLRPITAARSA